MTSKFCVVYVTTPQGVKGRQIAETIVKRKLAACVNVVPVVQSIYWWKGRVVKDGESLLVIKTRSVLFKKLAQLIKKIHPYDNAEIISLPIKAGAKAYLDWVDKETH